MFAAWPIGPQEIATRQMPTHCQVRVTTMSMGSRKNEPSDPTKAQSGLSAQELCAIEVHVRGTGSSRFVYDEELDVFRFPDDGRFAFCKEFADWKLLRERGYL